MILFFDVAASARAVSMSPRWVRQQVAAGLPVLRTDGKILISPDVLKEWMTSRYTPKPVDLEAAYKQADELTSGRRRGRKATR